MQIKTQNIRLITSNGEQLPYQAEIDLIGEQGMDLLAVGVILLDSNTKILSISRKARQLIEANGSLGVVNNQLRAESTGKHQLLTAHITESVKNPVAGGQRPTGALRIPPHVDHSIEGDLEVLVMAYNKNCARNEPLTSQIAAVVYIKEMGGYLQPNFEILQQMYGLTRKEASVCRLLLQNASTDKIASTLSVSVNGIHYHFKNIYRKLGAGRRSEVIQILSRSLALLTRDDRMSPNSS